MLRVACHFDGHRASDHAQRPRGTPIGSYWDLLDPYWPPVPTIRPYCPLLARIGPYWTPLLAKVSWSVRECIGAKFWEVISDEHGIE